MGLRDKKGNTKKMLGIDFTKKLSHFIAVQEKHKEYKKIMRTKELTIAKDNVK